MIEKTLMPAYDKLLKLLNAGDILPATARQAASEACIAMSDLIVLERKQILQDGKPVYKGRDYTLHLTKKAKIRGMVDAPELKIAIANELGKLDNTIFADRDTEVMAEYCIRAVKKRMGL